MSIQKNQRPDTSKLTRNDWLDAAFNAVVEGGFDQVRVLTLADTLGVTRGSFYWHFADHSELIAALLTRWLEQERASHQRMQTAEKGAPEVDLDRLLDVALAHGGAKLENVRFELALRGLGRRDPAVATALLAVDQMRLQLFESKFQRLTGDTQVAADLAALFYLAIVGSHQALCRPDNAPQTQDYLKRIISRYLIHRGS
jgi:AcrR family transcriptional regulator